MRVLWRSPRRRVRAETVYSSFDRRDRIAIRSALVGAWLFVALGAVGGVWLTPATVAEEIGSLAAVSAWIALVSAAAAMVGVLANRYWMEWVAAWFASLGLSVYSVGVWYIVLTSTPTRLQQAAYVTALIGFTVVRIAMNSAYASKQRKIHEIAREIMDGEADA